uniref:Uncharacterized protein n=1 Tax=Anguilla anguilla TaxID=7936 RepID=A0A0E9VHC2_ANGAN
MHSPRSLPTTLSGMSVSPHKASDFGSKACKYF